MNTPKNIPDPKSADDKPQDEKGEGIKGERIAKVMARAGLCSRRDAERWINDGRVKVNGKRVDSPALNVTNKDLVVVDDKPLPDRERSKIWRYHKPGGLVVSHRDEKGRASVFENLPPDMPRVVSVGRLDINTEGLLLLTNDGELARKLELPATGWLRRYRVRVFGMVNETALAKLKDGIVIDGIHYGSIEATLDRQQGNNNWLTISLREGKNREIKVICEHLGLQVNRLIRLSFGPFQLGDLNPGKVEEVSGKVLAEQTTGNQKQNRTRFQKNKSQKSAESKSAGSKPKNTDTKSSPTKRKPKVAHRRRNS